MGRRQADGGGGGDEQRPLLHADQREITYYFNGKIAIVPLFIIVSLMAGGLIYAQAKLAADEGTIEGIELNYAIFALVLFATCIACFVSLLWWIVFRITFRFSRQRLVVVKRGVFRSATLEFDPAVSSLCYFRTHFAADQTWLVLVIKERDVYYKIAAWKGRGNQRQRFFTLFRQLERELAGWQTTSARKAATAAVSELVTRAEVQLINPFASRIRSTADDDDDARSKRQLCVEELDIRLSESFFAQLATSKRIES